MPKVNDILWITMSFSLLIYLLILFVPKERIREAWIVFLFNQTLTWSLQTVVLNSEKIICLVRPFPAATKAYFLDAFLFFPALAVLYYFSTVPAKRLRVLLQTILYGLIFVGWDYCELEFTNIKRYIHWSLAAHFVVSTASLYFARWFTVFFFRGYHSKGDNGKDEQLQCLD